MAKEHLKVIAGIDTHADTHHVAVITDTDRHLADKEFLAAGSGYQGIIEFVTGFGPVLAVGVEGTGSYGAELSRVPVRGGIHVVEVMRPNRQTRRLQGKSGPLDAYQAAGPASEPLTSTAIVLKRLAVRYRHLHQELALIDAELDAILALHAPMLRDLQGVGTDVASQLLVTVGDNPERVTTEAKFAALVGVAPIPASSGKTSRHRLSRGGDRQANKAIHRVVLVRMRYDSRTRAYVARRRQEGKSTKEIMRCLKRYVAREIYDQLLNPRPPPDAGTLRAARTARQLTLQQAADALHVWPTALSRLERGLTHDNDFHKRYETWLNSKSPATVQMPDPGLARVLPA